MPKRLLAILLFGILFSTTFSSSFAQTQEPFDVIVIGAGMSGLAAAKTLDEEGYNVLVLEARDRLGGRIWTDHSWEIPIDLGASWIHGIKDNPLWYLSQEYEIMTLKTNEISYVIYPEEYAENEDYYWELYEKHFLEQSLLQYEEKHPAASLKDAIDYYISTHLSPEDELGFRASVYGDIELDFAADAPDLAINYGVAYRIEGQDDNDVVFPGGYDQIIKKLAEGLEIKTGHVVEKIDYTGDTIEVTTTDQKTFSAKRVISTIPNGVLQSGDVKFSPELPDEKKQAINNLKMGLMNKNYFMFDKVFWDKHVDWIVHVDEDYNEWSFFFNFAKYTGKPLLMGFTTGQHARELEALANEKNNDKVIIEQGLETLGDIYGEKVTELMDYRVTKWASEKFSKGSYAYIHVGASLDDYKEMRKPIANKIFFAGEATDIYPQTVHGAYFSGIREAVRIINMDYKNEEGKLMSPLQQMYYELHPYYVECAEDHELIIRTDPTRAACVFPNTATDLIDRGWAKSPDDYLESILF